MQTYENCTLCGRVCRIDRSKGQRGFCGESNTMRIACAVVHFGEEPPVTGKNGSGTVFFSGCTLGCAFCQNWQISQGGVGREVSVSEFADICLMLQAKKAENINLVTPTHFIPSIAEGLKLAKERGLLIPVLWNTSGFEKVESLTIVHPYVDVYLPDLKTLDAAEARRLFQTSLYPKYATESLLFLAAERPLLIENGSIKRGVIVRHLALPDNLESSYRVIDWFAEHLKGRAILSLMMQYTPVKAPRCSAVIPDRFVNENEYESLVERLDACGIEDGFCQYLNPDDDWLPDFNKDNPFPSNLSKLVWNWKMPRSD